MRLINWRCPVQGMTNKWNTSTNNSTLPFRTFPLCHKMPRRFVCRLPYYLSIISSRRSFCWLHVPCIKQQFIICRYHFCHSYLWWSWWFPLWWHSTLLFKPHSNVFAIFILITTNWSCVDFWLKLLCSVQLWLFFFIIGWIGRGEEQKTKVMAGINY